MPNGNHHTKEDWAQIEAFFSLIAPALHDFAARRNLKLTKYYHDSPSWSFTFRHPMSGVAKIDVIKESQTHCSMHQSWWLDNYDAATRSIKRLIATDIDIGTGDLGKRLEVALTDILSWSPGNWDEVHEGYGSWHKHFTKDQFDAMNDEYPLPQG